MSETEVSKIKLDEDFQDEKLDSSLSDNDVQSVGATEAVYNGKQEFQGYYPTEEELHTLRKVADRLPLSAWSIAVVELCERFTYYGVSGPFQNYMQNPRHGPIPGALDLGQQHANALSYFFQFWCYVCPIGTAFVSDMYLGKFKAICVSAGIYIVGTLILFLTSLPVSIDHGAALGGLIAAMIVIGVGCGLKSCISPFLCEQYTITKPFVRELKSGERVIIDPAVTIQSIFMIFYCCINIGSLSSIATTELEKNVDFWAAYLLPFCFFFVGIAALVFGGRSYIKKPPTGSVIPQAVKICGIVIKNKFNFELAKPSYRQNAGLDPVPWSDLFVDEVRRALIACKVFAFYPIYWVVYGQMINNFVSQAAQMNTHKIPNDIMQNVDAISIIIFIPILDYFVYPFLRRVGIPFRPITRIFFGFMFAAASMAYASVLQHYIYKTSNYSVTQTVTPTIHVAIQTPAYFFIALSEIFASITGLEVAYSKAPTEMKSFVMSIFLLTNAFGSALGIALSPTAVDPKLVWMYAGLAIATAISGVIFWFLYRGLNAVEDELNAIGVDHNAEVLAELEKDKHRHSLERGEVALSTA